MMIQNWYEPYSPTILESTVPNKFVKIINRIGVEVLADEQKSVKWDWSINLVGKVHKEIQIPITDKEEKQYLADVMKQGCVEYLNYMREKNRAYNWYKLAGLNTEPTLKNIHLTHSRIVSQYAGEYNPWHKHCGDFSGVIYLKLPKDMEKEITADHDDHYPANGLIEFMYGEACDFRSDGLKFKPEVGKFLMFPSYLKHFVYPFYSKGDRRSMSFNAHMMV